MWSCWPCPRRPSRAYWRSPDWAVRTIAVATPSIGERGGTVTLASSRPGRFRWSHSHEQEQELELDVASENGSVARAHGVRPGEYTAVFESQCGATEELLVRVAESDVPTITGYRVQPASGEWSRDGEVVAETNLNLGADDKASLSWSSGHHTNDTRLRGVRPGVYVATITAVNGVATPCIHACAPARVGVRGEGGRP